MKTPSLLFLALAFSFCTIARASEETILNDDSVIAISPTGTPDQGSAQVPDQLKILGKGIRNHSGQSLAIACVGTDANSNEAACDRIRVVEFDQNIPSWVGPSFQITGAKDFKKKLKKEYRDKYSIQYVDWEAQWDDPNHIFPTVAGVSLSGGYFATLIITAANGILPATGILTSGVVIAMPFFAVAWLALYLQAHPQVASAMANGIANGLVIFPARVLTNGFIASARGVQNALISDATYSMTAQNGWNWAESPKKISGRKFEKIKNVLNQLPTLPAK